MLNVFFLTKWYWHFYFFYYY